MAESPQSAAVVCDLAALSPTDRERRKDLASRLRLAVEAVIEVANGFALRFPPDTEVLRQAAELIELERRCCPFLRFELRLEADGGALWLEAAGSRGAQEVLRQELLLA